MPGTMHEWLYYPSFNESVFIRRPAARLAIPGNGLEEYRPAASCFAQSLRVIDIRETYVLVGHDRGSTNRKWLA